MATCSDLIVCRWGARFRGVQFPVAIGRGGIGKKRGEGDNITPCGEFRIMEVFHRADRRVRWTRAIGPNDGWSDDPRDPDYNHLIDRRQTAFSHENLARGDGLYDLIAVLDFNYPDAVPGAGSAIFLHCWRRPRFPTAGCVALSPGRLCWVLGNWARQSRVIIR